MASSTSGVDFVQNGKDIDVVHYQGKSIDFYFIWGGSTPIDITGYTARMQVRKSINSSEIMASFTVANSRISIGTTDGRVDVTMDADDSASEFEVGNWVYDMELESPAGKVYLPFSGKFIVKGEVTR